MEYIRQIFEAKAIPDGKNLYIEGYAAVFNNVDSYNDILVPGSVGNFLASPDAKRLKFCAQHRQTDIIDVIGKVIEVKEDSKGIWSRAKISNTSKGRDAVELILDEAIDEISIGYITIDFEMKGEIRYLKEIKLREISLVIRAANPEALIQVAEIKQEEVIAESETIVKETGFIAEPLSVKDMTNEELIEQKKTLEKEIEIRQFKQLLKII